MVQLKWDDCQEGCCKGLNVESSGEILDMASEMMQGCAFVADVYIDNQPVG